ncbi:MAG TPA: TraR/DksA family transcriptional regulator, partial [Planctomycetota bacterium]|nr:TraR/DksA family transcriptional regulator [Planctomycetota bacterium]
IRKSLLDRRAELLGSIGNHELGDANVEAGGDEVDQANRAATADLSLRLAESEYRELQEIEVALGKLADGSYGICEVTGKPIDVRRLLYMPACRLSLEAQRKLEAQQIYHDEQRGWVTNEF